MKTKKIQRGQGKYPHDKFFINLPQHRRVDTRSATAGLKLDKTTIPNPSSFRGDAFGMFCERYNYQENMELPNKSHAYIFISKITDYLLSETHIVGRSKARFFRSFGFDETNVSQFEQGLIHIAQTELVSEITETIYGKKYVIDGELETPNGNMIHLRTVWVIETGDDIPKLVTAYPLD